MNVDEDIQVRNGSPIDTLKTVNIFLYPLTFLMCHPRDMTTDARIVITDRLVNI